MYELDPKYLEKLEAIAGEIQASDELEKYLDTEEEEDFNLLKEMYEPKINKLYNEVTSDHPLQIISFETVLLEDVFEGLFLPRILGYAVLRGHIDNNYKYTRPQEHFKEVLFAICHSSNFDILRKRIGQTIQIGFALSSDIWVTNLINEIINKRIRYFLQGLKADKYRRLDERRTGYVRYNRQFRNENFQTAEFPVDLSGLKILYPELKDFLLYRIGKGFPNHSIIPSLSTFIKNEHFQSTDEYVEIISLFINFFEIDDDDELDIAVQLFNDVRQAQPTFVERYLSFILELHHNKDVVVGPDADRSASGMIDRSIDDLLSHYYDLTDTIHDKGYTNEEVHVAVKEFYNSNPGRSTVNDCLRFTIYRYFHQLITHLEVKDYAEWFEIAKLFPVYMQIFGNQQFNQSLKEICMKYVKKLLRNYTDKRGKDYQDIKKFVSATFTELGFLKSKEVVELFKTKRKKKTPA